MNIIGIVGSREYPNLGLVTQFVRDKVQLYKANEEILMIASGGAQGVDSWAVNAAKQLDCPSAVFPYIRELGKKGGMIRNSMVVEFCDEIYAFWDGSSRGTFDSISKAKKAGKLKAVYGPAGLEIEV